MQEGQLIQYWSQWEGEIRCYQTRKSYNSKELRELSTTLMYQFLQMGIQPGDTVGFVLANTVAFPVCLIACLQLKANPILLHSGITENELRQLQEKVCINWLLYNKLSMTRITDDFAKPCLTLSIHNLCIIGCALEPQTILTIPEQGVILHLTSGTYGTPLLCIRNQDVAIAEAANYVAAIQMYDHIKIRVTTPLNHAFAYGFGLMAAIITNSILILDTEFNPKRILREETNNTSDLLCVVPPMLKPLMHLKKNNPQYLLPSTVYYAGMGCSPSLEESFEKAFDTNLYAILGTTETGSIANNNNSDGKGMGVGRILPNVRVRLESQDQYQDLGDGIGELCIKSTAMMQRYVHDPIDRNINYFNTGDIAYLDSNDNLHLVGRIRDIINIGGIKVDPVEVENILLKHPAIKDAAVYAGATRDQQEVVLAAIVAEQPLSEIDVLTYCHERTSHYKVPVQLFFLESIPRTASGKCIRFQLPGYHQAMNTVWQKS